MSDVVLLGPLLVVETNFPFPKKYLDVGLSAQVQLLRYGEQRGPNGKAYTAVQQKDADLLALV